MALLTPRQRANFEALYIPEPMSGCFIWTGYLNGFGYGKFHLNGRAANAHRVSFEDERGTIPDGMLVLHNCDVACCVNPAHLRLGTDAENGADKIKRQRVPRKLSGADVIAVRSAAGRYRDIAADYGISASYVSLIKGGLARSGG